MTEHARFLHELHYWIEIALAPLLLWLTYRVAKALWRRGMLGDDWPDPPVDVDKSAPDDLVSVQPPPAAESGEPAPWRR